MTGKVPSESHSKMESFRFLAVMLSWILSGTISNLKHPATLKSLTILTYMYKMNVLFLPFKMGYACRTGNITLRCQYDGVENVLGVLWIIGVPPTNIQPTYELSLDTLPSFAPSHIRR